MDAVTKVPEGTVEAFRYVESLTHNGDYWYRGHQVREAWMAGYNHLRDAAGAGGWRAIESAPKDEEIVLVYHGTMMQIESAYFETEVWHMSEAFWSIHQKEWICPTGDNLGRITHWQPLPPPPRSREGA